MTVIVFDGRTLASDGLTTGEWRDLSDDTPKFCVPKKGVLLGAAGGAIWCDAMGRWAKTRRGKFPMAVTDGVPDGDAMLYTAGKWQRYYSDCPLPQRVGKFWAVGSGSAYAVAALTLGHDAIAACWVAMQLDPHCGGSIWAADMSDLLKRGTPAITRRHYAAAKVETKAEAKAGPDVARPVGFMV